jgi:bacteriophage N4 adsorption protein B
MAGGPLHWLVQLYVAFVGFYLSDPVQTLVLAYWSILQIVLAIIAVLIFVMSAEDMLIDVVYWVLTLHFPQPQPSLAALCAEPESNIAVLIPAWREAGVIGRMLLNMTGTFAYERYHIFVGVYANDAETRLEVDRAASQSRRVHRVQIPHDGPTNKADCLNGLIRAVIAFEAERSVRFDIIVNHDAEDVVHPYGLKVMNYFLDGFGMVQLPVRSLDRDPDEAIACVYMDEFAEWHGKDMVVRSALTGMVPSAGVGTAIGREALDALCRARDGEPFNTGSLTEDYDIAHRLSRLGFRSRFVKYTVSVPIERRNWLTGRTVARFRHELVDTREYFPNRRQDSVRQKARWMLGICFLGWQQIGWQGSWINRWFLWRDRKAPLTAPTAIVGYFLIVQWLILIAVSWAAFGAPPLPPLDMPWLWTLISVNMLLMLNRLLHRAIFVGQLHGLKHVWRSPLRVLVGNWVTFLAFVRAVRLYANHLITGRPIAWDKTMHKYPTAAELYRGKQQLGDVLTYSGAITNMQLATALRMERRCRRPLGLLLLDTASVEHEKLAEAYGELFGIPVQGFDPLLVDSKVRDLLPLAWAGRLGAFAVARTSLEDIVVAVGEPLNEHQLRLLHKVLSQHGIRRVNLQFAPLSDVAFGVRFAYDQNPLSAAKGRLQALLREGRIGSDREGRFWRELRRDYVRLGDVLVRMGMAQHRAVQQALWAADQRPLGHVLLSRGSISHAQLSEALKIQRELLVLGSEAANANRAESVQLAA